MTLKIHVQDKIEVFDKVADAVEFIEKVIKEFIDSGSGSKLEIVVENHSPRGPPTLGISVEDKVDMGEALG